MDAIEYLTDQHREIESLFDQFETAARMKPKLRLWRKMADLLAVHRAIEEKIFVPAAEDAGIEEPLLESIEEHLAADCIIAQLVEMEEVTHEMMAKMLLLKEWKRRHTDEEETALFPRLRELLTQGQLDALGERMESLTEELLGFGAQEHLMAHVAQA